MSNSLDAVSTAIRQILYESLTGDSSFQGAIEKKSIFLTTDIPGQNIDLLQFQDPWLPNNPNGSMVSVENFSLLVDSIPKILPKFFPSGDSIDSIYGEIVNNASVQTVSSSVDIAAYEAAYNLLYVDTTDNSGGFIKTKIESLEHQDYLNNRANYRNLLLEYNASFNQFSRSNPIKWALLDLSLKIKIKNAESKLKTQQALVIESALDVLRNSTSSTIASNLFSKAKQVYETTKRSSLTSPLSNWHLTSAFPIRWFDANMINFTIISNESFTLEFARVEIRRPWLNPNLFSFDQWIVAGRQKGFFSTGDLDNNSGIFSLLPIGFIIGRNIVVNDIGGSNISYPNPQIIAWINRVIPLCPPS